MNILLITYYYDPYNIIATRRPVSWANYLSKQNKVTVITRSWTGRENGISDSAIENLNETVELQTQNLKIIKIPYKLGLSKKEKTPTNLIAKMKGLYKWYFGKFNDVPFIKENFEKKIESVIKNNNFDLVIYTCNPYEFLYIAKRIWQKTHVKYVIDFRDLVSNLMLKHKVSCLEDLYKRIMKIRLHNVLKNASTIVTVSDPIKDIIKSFYKRDVFTIYNGFDEKAFDHIKAETENNSIFQITYTGNLFPDTDVYPLLEGIALFFENFSPKAQLNFVGTRKKDLTPVLAFKDRIKLNIIEWLPYEEAIRFSKRSSVLLSIGYPGYTGILSGKIFDYLGLQKTIVLAPSNEDALEDLIRKTNAGYVANTAAQVEVIFADLYNEWLHQHKVIYKGNVKAIKEFTRENQAVEFERILKNI